MTDRESLVHRRAAIACARVHRRCIAVDAILCISEMQERYDAGAVQSRLAVGRNSVAFHGGARNCAANCRRGRRTREERVYGAPARTDEVSLQGFTAKRARWSERRARSRGTRNTRARQGRENPCDASTRAAIATLLPSIDQSGIRSCRTMMSEDMISEEGHFPIPERASHFGDTLTVIKVLQILVLM